MANLHVPLPAADHPDEFLPVQLLLLPRRLQLPEGGHGSAVLDYFPHANSFSYRRPTYSVLGSRVPTDYRGINQEGGVETGG